MLLADTRSDPADLRSLFPAVGSCVARHHHHADIACQPRRKNRAPRRWKVLIESDSVQEFTAPYDLVKTMRASILVLGPLLARHGQARVSFPGGCAIGSRPVDLHIRALEAMGAAITIEGGYIVASAPEGLQGVDFTFDTVTVGGTENAVMAASLAAGTSVLRNVAREPEIVDLVRFLRAMGAHIEGEGSDTMTVQGVATLNGAPYEVMPDRIEVGTYLVAAAATGGSLRVEGICPEVLGVVRDKLGQQVLISMRVRTGSVWICGRETESGGYCDRAVSGVPHRYAGPVHRIEYGGAGDIPCYEAVFENRLMQAHEMKRMGADIVIEGDSARITGRPSLQGAPVMASDLRASASLVIAGLVASGETRIDRIYHIDRGYENIEGRLQCLGADIRRIST